jgi:hypothetical protein
LLHGLYGGDGDGTDEHVVLHNDVETSYKLPGFEGPDLDDPVTVILDCTDAVFACLPTHIDSLLFSVRRMMARQGYIVLDILHESGKGVQGLFQGDVLING